MTSIAGRVRSRTFGVVVVMGGIVCLFVYGALTALMWNAQDALMQQNAEALGRILDGTQGLSAPPAGLVSEGAQEKTLVPSTSGFQYWNAANNLVAFSANFGKVGLDESPPGFSTTVLMGHRWRVLTVLDASHRWLRIAQRMSGRLRIERRIGGVLILSLIISAALLALAASRVVRFSLEPVNVLADRISRHRIGNRDPVGSDNLPDEFDPIIASVNKLLLRSRTVNPELGGLASG